MCGKKVLPVFIALLLLSGLVGTISVESATFDAAVSMGGYGNYPPPGVGNWIITGNTAVWNEAITINGSLTITGTGRLTLINCTLKMNCTSDGQYKIQVNSTGEFYVYDSTITPYNTAYKYRFEVYGRLWTNHSTVQYMWGDQNTYPYVGGIQIYGSASEVWLNHTLVTRSGGNGIHCENIVGLNITNDCNITGNTRAEIYARNCKYLNLTYSNFTDYIDARISNGVFFVDCKDIIMEHCFIAQQPGDGIYLWNISDSMIRYCDIGVGAGMYNNIASGILVQYCDSSLKISWNNITESGGSGILIENASPIIENNNIFKNGASSVSSYLAGSHLYLFNNTIANNSADGVHVQDSNATIINNTFWKSGIDMQNSNAWIENCYITGGIDTNGSSPFVVNTTLVTGGWGRCFTIENDSHLFALNCTVDYWGNMIVKDTSNVTVQNFLHVNVVDSDGITPINNAWANVTDNGISAYSGRTDSNGKEQWVIVTNRTYLQDYWTPFLHPFTNISYNETMINVKSGAMAFGSNPRVVGMGTSHWEEFQALNATFPAVTYVTPPTPPANATLAVNQGAVIRVHYYNNESASNNATLFWRNLTGTWQWKSMDNISFWNGSYNNYFEANFTESSSTTVTYYVNCTSAANLTASTPPRTLDFAMMTEVSVNLTLSPGWNLISFPVAQPKINSTTIACAHDMATATGCTMLSKWNASGQIFINYIAGFSLPTDPENFVIGDNDGVFVWWNGTYDITFIVTGYEPGLQNAHLLPGWNIVGYGRLTVGDVEADWAGQVSCDIFDDICYYEDGTFKHYIFPGTKMALVPTRGYFIWSDNETWLNY
jgi:hypothetical protein